VPSKLVRFVQPLMKRAEQLPHGPCRNGAVVLRPNIPAGRTDQLESSAGEFGAAVNFPGAFSKGYAHGAQEIGRIKKRDTHEGSAKIAVRPGI